MKILGQSVTDVSERFFHSLYVSAQSGQYLDGTIPDQFLLTSGLTPLLIVMSILLMSGLVVILMKYLLQRSIPVNVVSEVG